MKRAAFTFALAALALLPGCAFLQNLFNQAFQKPTLTFKAVNLRDVSFGGATLDVIYTLRNPNPIGLSLAEVDYALSIEGHGVVSGRPPNGLTLARNGSADLTFPATVRFQDLAPVLETFLNKDTAHYRAQGHVGLRTPLGVLRFPISKEGQFEVPKIPALQLQSPRVTGLSFHGATLELPVAVTNRNSYALPIGGISGALQVAGHPVGSLNLGSLGTLSGRQSRTLTIPVSLQFAEAAQAMAALRGSSTTLGFQGQVSSGGHSLPVHLTQVVSLRH